MDDFLTAAKKRALGPGAREADAVAAMTVVAYLADQVSEGLGEKALGEIAAAPRLAADVRAEAELLAHVVSGKVGDEAALADAKLGVLTELAILGPFRDTGGGVHTQDGPEQGGYGSFFDASKRYSWGTVEVGWRKLPRSYATARGVPLDVFVHPRGESCSWIASAVDVPSAQPVVVRLAATGQVRLMFDGAELAVSEDANSGAVADWLAVKVDATKGAHVVAAKVCEGAIHDAGRVRLRLTNPAGAPLVFPSHADLTSAPRCASKDFGPHGCKGAAPGAKRVTTPLERTLAQTGELAFDGAILRVLGGADDSRSPRAPGILATVAGGPASADKLAMVAWLAPSGLNKSGWLNSARARAEAEGDQETRAFVARQILSQHVAQGLPDWAMAERSAAKLDEAKDAGDLLLGAHIDVALGVDALRLKAVRALEGFFDAAKDTAPDALLRDLASTAQAYDPGKALLARDQLAARGELSAAWVDAVTARGGLATTTAAIKLFDGALDDADEGITAARSVARAGAHDAALSLYRQLLSWAPNRAEVWAGVATEVEATHPDAAAINAALRRARELEPGEASYRAELALRQSGAATGDTRDDERHMVQPRVFLDRRLKELPPPNTAPDVADRQLHWLRAVVMHADRRVSQLLHYAREMVIPPRTQDELFEDIPAEGDLTEILRARVHRQDGGVAFPVEEHERGGAAADPLARARARRRRRGRRPHLDRAAPWAVAVTRRSTSSTTPAGSPTHPILYNEVVVEAPRTTPHLRRRGERRRRPERGEGRRRART